LRESSPIFQKAFVGILLYNYIGNHIQLDFFNFSFSKAAYTHFFEQRKIPSHFKNILKFFVTLLRENSLFKEFDSIVKSNFSQFQIHSSHQIILRILQIFGLFISTSLIEIREVATFLSEISRNFLLHAISEQFQPDFYKPQRLFSFL
jgi:hypothetical protein